MYHGELDNFLVLNLSDEISDLISVILMNVIFVTVWCNMATFKKICIIQFLNDCVQNYAWLKDLLKVQDRPNNFKVTEYKKFTDMVSGSTWQLTVKELP